MAKFLEMFRGWKEYKKQAHKTDERILNEQNYLGTYGYMKTKGRINLEGRSKDENDITKMKKKRTHSKWLKYYGHCNIIVRQELAYSKKCSEWQRNGNYELHIYSIDLRRSGQ